MKQDLVRKRVKNLRYRCIVIAIGFFVIFLALITDRPPSINPSLEFGLIVASAVGLFSWMMIVTWVQHIELDLPQAASLGKQEVGEVLRDVLRYLRRRLSIEISGQRIPLIAVFLLLGIIFYLRGQEIEKALGTTVNLTVLGLYALVMGFLLVLVRLFSRR